MNDIPIDRRPRALLGSVVIATVLGAGCNVCDVDDVLVFSVPAAQPTDPATGIAAHLYVRTKANRELRVATGNGLLHLSIASASVPADCIVIRADEPAELELLIHPAQIETAVEATLQEPGADASSPTCTGRIVDISTIFVKSSAPTADAGVVDTAGINAEGSDAR